MSFKVPSNSNHSMILCLLRGIRAAQALGPRASHDCVLHPWLLLNLRGFFSASVSEIAEHLRLKTVICFGRESVSAFIFTGAKGLPALNVLKP